MTSLKLLAISKFVLNNLIFAESMHHRHFRDQDQTVIHQIIDRYTLAYAFFCFTGQNASPYQKYVAGRWFFLEL